MMFLCSTLVVWLVGSRPWYHWSVQVIRYLLEEGGAMPSISIRNVNKKRPVDHDSALFKAVLPEMWEASCPHSIVFNRHHAYPHAG